MDRERIVLPSGLLLLSSILGYILTGKYPDPTDEETKDLDVIYCLVMPYNDLWNLDTIGIRDSVYVKDDDRALENFNSTVSYRDGQYFITWPWKSDDVNLKENFDVAYNRMKSLSR